MTYTANDGQTRVQDVAPYGLVAKAGVWYLVARRAEDGAYRTYRVDRIEACTVTTTPFVRDAAFDLAEHWQAQQALFLQLSHTPVSFTLRLPRAQLGLLRLHANERLTVVDNSADAAHIDVSIHVDDWPTAVMLVFGLGPHVSVLRPDTLHDALRKAVLSWATALHIFDAAGA